MITTDTSHPAKTSLFPTGRLLALFVLVWLTLFSGINTIPLEEHEAYVIQSAREMTAKNDWIVPYFSQRPRLNKPPLNYWLTMTLSRLDPFSDDIEPWHGRAWSLAGALLLVLMTAYVGNRLYGMPAGFLAAALLLGTKGFTEFSHDARPDFVYSVLCVSQLFAWISAWRADDDTRVQRLYAALGWGLAGLATLTKGPQVPAVFMLAFLFFLVCGHERYRTLKVLRPFSGLTIMLALCLPWWLLLKQRIATLGLDIGKTQLSGSLLLTLSGWKEIFSFFYVSRVLNLLLPVSLLLPILFFLNRKNLRRKIADVDRLFLLVIFIMIAVFTVGGHYRARNMLPLLPPVALLMAASSIRAPKDAVPEIVWRVLFWLGSAAVMIFPARLIIGGQYAPGAFLVVTGLLSVLLLTKAPREAVWSEYPFAANLTVLFLLVTIFFAGYNVHSVRSDRTANREFSLSVVRIVHPGDLLIALNKFPGVLPYYARHPVVSAGGLDRLKKIYDEKSIAGRDSYLLVLEEDIATVAEVFDISILLYLGRSSKNPDEKLVLAKIVGKR